MKPSIDVQRGVYVLIWDKHQGRTAPARGGYVWEDQHWLVDHAPTHMGRLGTLVVEARQHYLDFADMLVEEQTSYGPLLHRLYTALQPETGAERSPNIVLLEEQPHVHAWLILRLPNDQLHSIALPATDEECNPQEAAQLAARLHNSVLSNDLLHMWL